MALLRVQRIIQQAGLGSRRQAEAWIKAGRVTIDGIKAQLGDLADPDQQKVAVDSRPVIPRSEPLAYLALYKPRGYTTSMKDRHAEHLITELIPRKFGRVFPVGRLDKESEGLIILTNDGVLAHALMHPSREVKKVYDVWVKGIPKKSHLERMRQGIALEDGPARPDVVELISRREGRALIRVVLHEGKNREIRRIFDSIGHGVEELIRIRYANIGLNNLEPGQFRPLTHREVRELKAVVIRGLDDREPAPKQTKSAGGPRYSKREKLPARRSGTEVGRTPGNSGRTHR